MKKALLSVLLPGLLLAYQPASPAPVFLTHVNEPTGQRVIWPLIIGGAVAIGIAGGGGIWFWNKILNVQEHLLTNSPPQGVAWQFTTDEYPE